MGSSGAGKSTLMNVLAKRNLKRVKIDGKIAFNGSEYEDDVSMHCTGYIQQEDYFLSSLTVREHLRYHAKLIHGFGHANLEYLIEDKIQLKGLQNCADDIIGDPHSAKRISGGERKRLAIATEILSDPMIIFADEPTSGLDSFMATTVVNVLDRLAKR
jgi:ABC-type multidrug transport system ATPase subunit